MRVPAGPSALVAYAAKADHERRVCFPLTILGVFVQLRQQSSKPIRNPLLNDIVGRDAQLTADLGLDIAVEGS